MLDPPVLTFVCEPFRSSCFPFSLSQHRHPYLCIPFGSRFICYHKNNLTPA
jgi:hypothetical protein